MQSKHIFERPLLLTKFSKLSRHDSLFNKKNILSLKVYFSYQFVDNNKIFPKFTFPFISNLIFFLNRLSTCNRRLSVRLWRENCHRLFILLFFVHIRHIFTVDILKCYFVNESLLLARPCIYVCITQLDFFF